MVIKGIKPERNPDKYCTIIGVDTSSTGIAWTALYKDEMMGQGKIELKQKDIVDKLAHVYGEWAYLLGELKPDYVMVEKSIFVKNPATARTLSYVVGTILAITKGNGYECDAVEPASWKSFMGYHNLSSKFVQQAKEKLGNTEGKKFCDRLRKSQTWRVIQHNYPNEATDSLAENDHDIADSWGIALYTSDLIRQPITLEKSREVSLDLAEMTRIGLAL
jgi:Holliday junction resolvasome RuvABC endonuclease subunit